MAFSSDCHMIITVDNLNDRVNGFIVWWTNIKIKHINPWMRYIKYLRPIHISGKKMNIAVLYEQK